MGNVELQQRRDALLLRRVNARIQGKIPRRIVSGKPAHIRGKPEVPFIQPAK